MSRELKEIGPQADGGCYEWWLIADEWLMIDYSQAHQAKASSSHIINFSEVFIKLKQVLRKLIKLKHVFDRKMGKCLVDWKFWTIFAAWINNSL